MIRRPTELLAGFRHAGARHGDYRRRKRVAFAARTKIRGRLVLLNGRGLPGQTVQILSAPDNKARSFKKIATAKTGSGGRWEVTLARGPSRLVKAVYSGTSTNKPAKSPPATVIVPAKVRVLRLWPRHVPWGGTVHIVGRLDGGYLPPPPAGEPVRLRIGYGRAFTTYGVKTGVTGNGRFAVTYKFGPGSPGVVRRYWFQECSLPHDDYPYAPACSRRITVRVGG